jgi:uncharacterized protein YndB with AHSA1/START domain
MAGKHWVTSRWMMVVARVEMLVRRPVVDVFDAFVQPRWLEKFWLKSASAPLSAGATVEWTFKVPGATETVRVTSFAPGERISFVWSDGKAVRIGLKPRGKTASVVEVKVSGFEGRDAASQAISATEGFALVLCDLKCLLETGRSGGMVRDKAALIALAAGR